MIQKLIEEYKNEHCMTERGWCLEIHVFGEESNSQGYTDVRRFVREWGYAMDGDDALPFEWRKRRWLGIVWGSADDADPAGGAILVALKGRRPKLPPWLRTTSTESEQ